MAQIISAIQEKGGAGKSTLIASLGGLFEKDGIKTLIIDTDNQQSSINWATKEDLKNVDHASCTRKEDLLSAIEHVDAIYDVVLIDTAGFDNDMNSHVIVSSDLILIPTGHNESTIKRAVETYKNAIALTKNHKSPPEVRLVLWNVKKQTTVFKACKEFIIETGHKFIDCPVPSLVGFENMTFNGGLPDGKALSSLKEFYGALQMDGLLDHYNNQFKEVANG